MKSFIGLCVKRPISVAMAVFAMCILGAISVSRLPIDYFPDIEIPVISVSTTYDGAGPEEVETSITRIIESAVSGVTGIVDITSTSAEGSSSVSIEFDWGSDLSEAASEIREAIDRIRSRLPDEADSPTTRKFSTSTMPVMGISLGGAEDLAALYELADSQIIKKLEQVPGVGEVRINGGLQTRVNVDVDLNRLQAYGLSINSVAAIIANENVNSAGGSTYEGVYKYNLRTTGEFEDLEDMKNVVVTVKDNVPVRLRDIAEIYYGYNDSSTIVRVNQQPGLLMYITKESGKNTIAVARDVIKRLEELEEELPPGVYFQIISNNAEFIEQAIYGVAESGLQGALVAVFVLMLYLWNIRTVSIIAISIPVSIIGTFVLMYFLNITLNIISIAGLTLGIGMMVDSSIVVLENIVHFRQNGYGKYKGAIDGTAEVSVAISASTFTTVAVFLPFLFLEGKEGQIFGNLAMVVTISLLTALVVAVTIVPVLSARMISETTNHKLIQPIENAANKILDKIDERYGKILGFAIKRKKSIFFLSLIAVFAVIGGIGMIIDKEGYPTSDEGSFSVSVQFPVGTRIEYTDSMTKQIEQDIIDAINEVNPTALKFLNARVRTGRGWGGASVDNRASISGSLVESSERPEHINVYLEAMRNVLSQYPARINVRATSSSGPGGSTSTDGIEIQISGEDLDRAQELGEQIVAAIENIEGVREPEVAAEDRLPEIAISINRDKAAKMGLNTSTISSVIETAFGGSTTSTMLPAGFSDSINIYVRLREEDRNNIEDLSRLMVQTATGEMVPLSSVADFKRTTSPSTISRKDSARITKVEATIYGRSMDKVMIDIQDAVANNVYIPSDFIVSYTGDYEDTQDSFKQLIMVFILAFILVYAIMASQFESLIAPFIIMFSVFYGAAGTLIALLITGRTLSVSSGIGMIVLIGIVINNGIVLIDYMNVLMHNEKIGPDEAALRAGPRRLRPVMMTTLTTIFGMLPMAIGLGSGSEMNAPLATAVVGGLAVSTGFTLVIVPIAYSAIRKKFPLKDYDLKDSESAQAGFGG